MKYQIIGKNIEVTEGISTALQNKLTRLDKYFLVKEDVECRCVVSAHNLIQKVEITVFLPNMPIRAEVENADLYAGIDLAIDKLEGQMRKIKTRMDRSNNRLSLGKAIDFEMIDEDEEVSKEKDVIVRAKSYYLTPILYKYDGCLVTLPAISIFTSVIPFSMQPICMSFHEVSMPQVPVTLKANSVMPHLRKPFMIPSISVSHILILTVRYLLLKSRLDERK